MASTALVGLGASGPTLGGGSGYTRRAMMFRSMTPDRDAVPLVKDSARGLGVRVPIDVRPDEAGDVYPAAGGMSVAPEYILNLPAHRRPMAMGHGSTGHDGDFVFGLDPGALSATPLTLRQTSATHCLIEPDQVMQLVDYRKALAQTREDWSVEWRP